MGIELPRRRRPVDLLPGKAATRLVVHFEGLSLRSYPDPASPLGVELRKQLGLRVVGWERLSGDPWTAGYGHTGPDVVPNMTITLKQADDWLAADLAEAAMIVIDNVHVSLTQGEFDALVSIAFNLGYIPKSMKACLNGGMTDRKVMMQPGSYDAALHQFPRNCRAAGKPMEGLLRRRLAESCVFSNLPWEAACSLSVVRLVLKPDGEIDTEETTSLEDTLERARRDIPLRPPETVEAMKREWPTTQTIIVDKLPVPKPEPEPQLETAATPANASVAVAPAPKEPPELVLRETAPPAPKPPAQTVELGKAAGGEAGPGPLVPPPTSAAKTPGGYTVDPKEPPKPIEKSDRGRAFNWTSIGILILGFGSRGAFGSSCVFIFEMFKQDPAMWTAACGVVGFLAISGIGYLKKTYGEWKTTRARERAIALMY